jgi:ABC-2 type transport system ATP-binding protein
MLRDVLRRSVERGATIFLTSHVLEIVEKLCTHVGIITRGKIVHQGPLAELQRGRSLEERFLEVARGDTGDTAPTLSWLEE